MWEKEEMLVTSMFSFSPNISKTHHSHGIELSLMVDFIDCMVFNAVFNSVLVISQMPVHLSMLSWSSFYQYSTQYSVSITIINPWKEYWLSRGSNQRPPVLKFATLLTELWGLCVKSDRPKCG